jgi:hypothetical protein
VNAGVEDAGKKLMSGLPVFTNDGAHLGHVDSVDAERGWFKVRAPQAPDFWLALEDLADVTPRYALLGIRRLQVRARRWEGGEPGLPRTSTFDEPGPPPSDR